MQRGQVTANSVEFVFLEDGPPDGPLALCLHGFPDTAHSFRHLLPALAEAGYHAVAPWMRGYAPTAVPADGAYQQGALGTDAHALHEALGGDGRAVVIGHDWGALAAYCAACLAPERWRRVVALAIPPPAAMGPSFFTYDQFKRSFYVFLFQTFLGEAALASEDLGFVARLWADWSPGYVADWDVARVKEALSTPENQAAALGYYRAMLDPSRSQPQYAEAQAATGSPPQPTLCLHGTQDGCFAVADDVDVAAVLSEGSAFKLVDGAGHFLHLEKPEEVNGLILEFLEG